MAAAASPPPNPSPTISALILGVAAPAAQTGVGATDDFKPSAESAQKSLAAQGIKVEVRPHPGGAEGVKLSLEEVAKRIREGKDDPLVAAWARRAIQANGDPQDPKGRAQALLTQLRKDVSYVPDPVGTEMMIKPRYVLCLDPKGLCFRGGDCDDLVITYGSAALSVGIQTKIIGEAFNGEKVPSHVLAAIFDPDSGDWLRVDPSTPYPVGEYVAGSNEVWIDPLSTAPVSLNGTSGGRFVGVGAVPARHAVGGGPLGDIALVPPPASTVGRNLLACAAGAGLVLFVGVQVMNARHAPIKKAIASPRTYKKAIAR